MVTDPQPTVLVFDVNETLLDIETLAPLFERLFGDAAAMREWFAQVVLYSEAMALSGNYAPFGAVGAGILRMLGEIRGVPVVGADTAELRARTLAMPAHDDVLPALERLKNAGFRLVTLTNSAPDLEASPLQRSGIARLTERQFSVDAVRRFKPHPDCYRQVAEALDLLPRPSAWWRRMYGTRLGRRVSAGPVPWWPGPATPSCRCRTCPSPPSWRRTSAALPTR